MEQENVRSCSTTKEAKNEVPNISNPFEQKLSQEFLKKKQELKM